MAPSIMSETLKNEVIPTYEKSIAIAESISRELRNASRLARSPRPITAGGGGFRARKSDRVFKKVIIVLFVTLFVLPNVISTMYFVFFAADQYEAEARLVIKSADTTNMEKVSALSSLFGGGTADTEIVAQYIKSRAIVDALQKEIDLRKVFSPGMGDFFAELDPEAKVDELVKYWKRQTNVSVEKISGLVTIQIWTFSPADSQRIANLVVKIAEQTVNGLAHRSQADAVKETLATMRASERRLEAATSRLRDARTKTGVLDVDSSNEVYAKLLTSIRLDLSTAQQEESLLLETGKRGAPQLIAVRARIEAISDQLKKYENDVVGRARTLQGPVTVQSLADNAVELSERELDLNIAQSNYALASAAHEKARMTFERQQSYLVPFVAPALSEKSNYPSRGMATSLILMGTFLVWCAIFGLANLARNHMA